MKFEINTDVIGKNAKALTGAFIVEGKPLTTTYDIRNFIKKISNSKKTVIVSVSKE